MVLEVRYVVGILNIYGLQLEMLFLNLTLFGRWHSANKIITVGYNK